MDIANIFIIYHINRKNTKESNAGILYIEKKLKAECVSMNLNSLMCLFLACSSMLFILISGGCIPCKENKLFKTDSVLCPQTVYIIKMNFKVV